MTKSWGKADDAKLNQLLLQGPPGGSNPSDTTSKAIHEAIKRIFLTKNYTSFAPLYRRKLSAFRINAALQGSSRGKKHQSSSFSVICIAINRFCFL